MTKVRKKTDYTVVMIAMGIQILLGLCWMAKNITAIPAFGDSNEYLELSKTLRLDEYRPILYPLILKVARKWSELTFGGYQTWMYLGQTICSFLSLFYGVSVLDGVLCPGEKSSRKRIAAKCFFVLYLMTIPMICFMNFAILTDSLATSMLVLFLSEVILMFSRKALSWPHVLLMSAALLAENLLRADRLYSCLLLAVIAFVIRLFGKRVYKKQILAAMICVCLVVPGITKAVNSVTQTPGINGRIQTTFDFVLLDRIVWPNMLANYDSFPPEIKAFVTKKEAKKFDKHNNNVMYQMAPLIEARAGKENAGKIYRQMAKIVLKNQPGKVLGDIGEDILAMLFTPVSSLLSTYGRCEKGDAWNVYCMSGASEKLTVWYNKFYQHSFVIMFILAVVMAVMKRKGDHSLGNALKKLMPYAGMGLIFTLWFCLGDGAPPNDRYALILYLGWALLAAALLGYWEKETEK